MNPTDDHAAREAEIRQRIAEEVKQTIQKEQNEEHHPHQKMYRLGWRVGMDHALRIIERGAATEGER